MELTDKRAQEIWEVSIDSFHGPLDLLLHLIHQYEIDIYDIPIAEITTQYLDYIRQMQSLELDIAGEYLVMASTLLQIKSELLVPRNQEISYEDDDYISEEDPRDHLVHMLLEYKRFKEIVPEFEKRHSKRGLLMTKSPTDLSKFQEHIPLKEDALDLSDLQLSMSHVLARYELLKPNKTTISADEKTVEEQVDYITKFFQSSENSSATFTELLQSPSTSEIVVTFLAILELMKKNKIHAKQKNIQSEILVKWIDESE